VSEKTTELSQQNLPRNWWWRSHWGRNKAVGDVPVSSRAPAWWNFVEASCPLRLHHWRSDTDMLRSSRAGSRQEYTVPVCYIREGDGISCITKVGWWRNLRGGVPSPCA